MIKAIPKGIFARHSGELKKVLSCARRSKVFGSEFRERRAAHETMVKKPEDNAPMVYMYQLNEASELVPVTPGPGSECPTDQYANLVPCGMRWKVRSHAHGLHTRTGSHSRHKLMRPHRSS